jgi:hypothetical protein
MPVHDSIGTFSSESQPTIPRLNDLDAAIPGAMVPMRSRLSPRDKACCVFQRRQLNTRPAVSLPIALFSLGARVA